MHMRLFGGFSPRKCQIKKDKISIELAYLRCITTKVNLRVTFNITTIFTYCKGSLDFSDIKVTLKCIFHIFHSSGTDQAINVATCDRRQYARYYLFVHAFKRIIAFVHKLSN